MDESIITFGHDGEGALALAFSPDGKRIVSGSFLTAKVWDAKTGAELMTLPADDGALGVAFSPDGKAIAGACGRNIILWESGARPVVDGSEQSGESTQNSAE